MGEVGSESSRNLEWDLIPRLRAIQEFCSVALPDLGGHRLQPVCRLGISSKTQAKVCATKIQSEWQSTYRRLYEPR